MLITGTTHIIGNEVDSNGDHRIAMALATMASVSNSPINILNADVVAKSYSNYFNDLEKVSN